MLNNFLAVAKLASTRSGAAMKQIYGNSDLVLPWIWTHELGYNPRQFISG